MRLALLVAILAQPNQLVQAETTAYCACSKCCGQYADGITASGHIIKPNDHFVAAPPDWPFGTSICIPGYGCTTIQDRGGAIKNNRLDLYFDTHQSALQWGRKNQLVLVEIWR